MKRMNWGSGNQHSDWYPHPVNKPAEHTFSCSLLHICSGFVVLDGQLNDVQEWKWFDQSGKKIGMLGNFS